MDKTNFTVGDDGKTLVMQRTFSVPKDKVWEAFSSASALEKWWGPVGWDTEVKKLDFTDGGEWIYVMKCVDEAQGEWFGQTSAGKTVYSNIQPKDSMEYVDYFTDEEGNINEEMPSSHSAFELEQTEDGNTKLTITTTYETPEALKQVIEMGMEEGYGQTMDKLAEFLSSAKRDE